MCFFITEGEVRVVNYSSSGRETAFADVSSGGYIGEIAAIDGMTRSASVVALTACTIAIFPGELFVELVESDAAIAFRLLRHLTKIIRTNNERNCGTQYGWRGSKGLSRTPETPSPGSSWRRECDHTVADPARSGWQGWCNKGDCCKSSWSVDKHRRHRTTWKDSTNSRRRHALLPGKSGRRWRNYVERVGLS